ncbi:MAG: adenylyl-sulfate kinase, partial [Gammaproteobacteria bacterium]|nr:adenylyl-sulfate kinase [Gammaproteobacteria bacterium]
LTGLSGAGKSTIANRLEQEIQAAGKHTYLLDGDNLRHGLNRDLGFSLEDRVENVRRVAAVAQVMVDAGLIVIAALISPLRSQREMARSLVPKGEFFEIFIDAPLDVCEARDPKGLYARARKGELRDFTGIDSPYEEPPNPELRIDTAKLSVDEAVAEILTYLGKNAPRQDRPAAQPPSGGTGHKRTDKFMISCTARSGSSMLSTLLNSHPRVLCHGEVLAAPHESAGPYHDLRSQGADVDDWLREYRQERPEAFLYDVCFNPAGHQSVGFKFKLEESLTSSYKSFRELLAADKDIKIIHLQRKNILDKYVSLQMTRQSGVFSIRSSSQRPDLRPFTIDIPDFIAYVRKDRQRYETAFEMFRDHPSLHLTYEELCESRPAALGKVQDFLELPQADLATMMIKVIKKNTDLVLNLDEVREALAAEDAAAEMSS